jgi:hypothetical protein
MSEPACPESPQLRVFEFRLIVGAARIVIGVPRQRFVRVNAAGEPEPDHAWEIGGDVLEALQIEDDVIPCWNVIKYTNGVTEYVIYRINDCLAGWCELTLIPLGVWPVNS